jgi:signal transduction histidine kinase
LTNAIKYSPKGGIITILARRDPLKQWVVVSIADQGIGIAPPDRESLFTLFHRIKRPETQGIEGTGLGLYVAKKFVQAMGGEIWVESELNRGSTFYVAVPVCQTPSA